MDLTKSPPPYCEQDPTKLFPKSDINFEKITSNYILSDELSEFLNVPPKSIMSLHDVVVHIYNYVIEHDLTDSDQRIMPDTKLSLLLCITYDDGVMINNFTPYIIPHLSVV